MSPDVWTALILGGSAVLIAGLVAYAARLDGDGGHTHRNVRRRAVIPFADPADRDDPHGEQYIARLSADDKPHPDLGALTPGPVGTGWLAPLPDDDPADTTGVQPVATCELGAPVDQYLDDLFPDGQYVSELFDGHAGAQQ